MRTPEHTVDVTRVAHPVHLDPSEQLCLGATSDESDVTASAPAGVPVPDVIDDAVPSPRIGFVVDRSVSSDSIEELAGRHGWTLQHIAPADLAQPDLARQVDLIIVKVDDVDHAAVELAAMTSRDPLTPVLVVARDRDPRHIADILSVGVDDYLIEPFAVEEFVVRVQSLIARARDQDARRPDERLVFDVSSRSVVVGSQVVTFSIREWNLLVTLLEADGSPLTATQLAVALDRAALMPAAIAVTISRLRRKLRDRGIDALDIVSTRGQGYAIRIRRP